MKTLPTDEKVLFMLCDNARPEANEKITLLGYFGGEDILLPDDVPFPSVIPLGIIFMLKDGDGVFDGALEITGPSGVLLPKMPMQNITKLKGANNGVIINLSPFMIPAFGDYVVKLTLDGKTYSRTFKVGGGLKV